VLNQTCDWPVSLQQRHHRIAASSTVIAASVPHSPLLAGIEALSRADKRFAPLADALFSRSALLLSRDQLTSEQEAELDQRLGVLLRLLTGHFLAPAAFQVLEFCVRRYK
jgi:hypothetical protein